MKSQRILGSMTALGIAGSAVFALTVGTSPASADDWPSSNQQPAWSQRCDRDWDNDYCNPKANSNRSEAWDRNQDRWQSRDPDEWDRNQDKWSDRDQSEWRNQDRYSRTRLLSGTYIPTSPERQRRVVLRRSERYPFTLVVTENVGEMNRRGRAILPRGSRIEGELVPTRSGYRFESDQVRFPNGKRERIWAVSSTIRSNNTFDRNDRNETNVSNGALTILSSILGRSDSSNTILGDVFERYPNSRRDLAVIYPERIDLRLTRDFVKDWRNF